MNWTDVLKADKERWERYKAARSKSWEQNRRTKERKPSQPRYKCAMCGFKLSRYDGKEHKKGQLNYCSNCKKHKEGKK